MINNFRVYWIRRRWNKRLNFHTYWALSTILLYCILYWILFASKIVHSILTTLLVQTVVLDICFPSHFQSFMFISFVIFFFFILSFRELLNDVRTENETMRMAHDYVVTKECRTVGGRRKNNRTEKENHLN